MLTPLGGTGHGFDSFAPRFIDRFHVLVLTRRGQGLSDKPPSGYDLDTLAADIKAFMDALHIDRAILVGHSIAGAEMTRFAITYPKRLSKLVYLDAAFDYALLADLMTEAHLPLPEDRTIALTGDSGELDERMMTINRLGHVGRLINHYSDRKASIGSRKAAFRAG